MSGATSEQITDELRDLSPAMLAQVREFIRRLHTKNGSIPPDEIHAELAEEGMGEYLSGLQDYENRLARGEIHWQ